MQLSTLQLRKTTLQPQNNTQQCNANLNFGCKIVNGSPVICQEIQNGTTATTFYKNLRQGISNNIIKLIKEKVKNENLSLKKATEAVHEILGL